MLGPNFKKFTIYKREEPAVEAEAAVEAEPAVEAEAAVELPITPVKPTQSRTGTLILETGRSSSMGQY